MKRIFCLLIVILQAISVFSQIDKEFWFVAPEVSSNHGDRPVYLRISTMEDTAHINLRMPANLNFAPILLTINPNTTTSIQLDVIGGNSTWLDSIENKPADQVLRKGLLLTSDKNVTAYYEVANISNPAVSSLKGKNAVGMEFYISSQDNYANQTNDGSESFDIVATEDNTTVTITPTLAIVGHLAGVPFQITLNKGETYSARTLNTTATASLKGSHVVSDKPIAITIFDDSIITGGWDEIADQTIPVNLCGWEYIAIKGFADNVVNNNDEHVYILATQDATEVRMDGNATPIATLNASQQYNYSIPPGNNTAYVKASKPVYVYHLSGHAGEAGSAILPQDSCTGSRQVGFNRTSSSQFAMLILCRNGNQDSFYLNGGRTVITAASFNTVPGTSNAWVYYRQNNLTTGQVPLGANLVKNTKGKFHLGILNMGSGGSSEYGYFSDFSSLYLGADNSICPSDSIILDGGQYMTTYEWKKLVSGTWISIDTNRFYTVHDSGYYACIVNGDFCSLRDTIHISYYPDGTVNLGADRTICQGSNTTFDPGLYVSYLWSTGSTNRLLTTNKAGQYWVRVTNNNDCIAYDTVNLFLDSLPQTNHAITGPVTVCQAQNSVIYSIPILPFSTTYQWTLPPGATGSSTANTITLDFSASAVSGNIKVHGVNSCGSGRDTSMFITVNPLPLAAGIITGPNEVCQGQNGVPFTVPVIPYASSYIWSVPAGASIVSGSGTNSITVDFDLNAAPGNIAVYGQNNCGTGSSSSKTLLVRLFPVPAGPISGSPILCQGQTGMVYSVSPITGADSYIWTLPAGCSITNGSNTNTITVYFDSTSISGNITVRGHSDYCGNGIPSTFPVTVNPLPVPAGPVSGTNPVCQGQNGVIYSVNPITAATLYLWTLPTGCTITGGSGTNSITVNFSNTASSGNISVKGNNALCGDGVSSEFPVTVNPLPVAAGMITGTSPVCQAQSNVAYSLQSIQYATSYLWNYTGTGGSITNSGNNITMNFSTTATSGFLSVKGQNSCGDGALSPNFPLTVNPIAQVSVSICNPVLTHDAKPFILKGGLPLGGTYSGTGVSGGAFIPSLVPAAKDTVQISYHYSNMYNCTYTAVQTLSIMPAVPFTCGDNLTDVRDNKIYPTVKIGGQCWMAANLNYGQQMIGSSTQRDNCVAEKYCFNDIPGNCTSNGGLYQWDELMQYDDLPSKQGLCPPAWHVPAEAEWNTLFNQFISNGFAGSPLKNTGYSGFNAFLSGIRGINNNWLFDNFSAIFWSSTSNGNYKARAHGMNEFNPSVSYYPAARSDGFYVRCIKD